MARQHVPLLQPPRGQCGGTPALWLHKALLSPLIKSGFSLPFPWPEVIAMWVGEELGGGGRDGQGPEGTQEVTQSSPTMDQGLRPERGRLVLTVVVVGVGDLAERGAEGPDPRTLRDKEFILPTTYQKSES